MMDRMCPIQSESEAQESRARLVATGLAGTAVSTVFVARTADGGAVRFPSFPYSDVAANGLNHLGDVLATVGEVGLAGAIATIGVTQVIARMRTGYSEQAGLADEISSRGIASEERAVGRARRWGRALLRTVGSGKFPTVAFAAATIAGLTSGIATEVTNGPDRPIKAMTKLFPGGESAQLIVEDDGAMPMVNSAITQATSARVMEIAQSEGVSAMPFAQYLTTIVDRDRDTVRTALVLGLPMPTGSLAAWNKGEGCNAIPVVTDTHLSADAEVGGAHARVVKYTSEELTAMNRQTIIVDRAAVQTCLQKTDNNYGIALGTTPQKAREILAEANTAQEIATVISVEQFRRNSERFWERNVKPITSILALMSGLLAFVSINSDITLRLAQGRRELAALINADTSVEVLRFSELLRNLKDTVVASAAGAFASAAGSAAVGSVVFGMRPGVGFTEAMVGAGTVFSGSMLAFWRRAGGRGTKRFLESIKPGESDR